MHPILVQLGPLTLRWYGLLIAVGFLAAFWLFRARAARIGLDEREASNLLLLLLGSGFFGARVYHIVWKWNEEYAFRPAEIFRVPVSGLVFFGGLIAASVALILWARWKNRPIAPVADALALPLAAAHAFGRLGCFMNGCCHGSSCDYPWAVRLASPEFIAGVPVHPTQLYESIGLVDIIFALWVIEKIGRYPGQVAWSYCILYAVLRFVVEFYRGDVPHHVLGRFTLAQVVCATLFLIAWMFSSRLAYLAAKTRAKTKRQTGP
ncbi:MAG: prolipoprotein diacylglyceryl transferase [Verrucomicrobia bacterium]|nr:prolipoprotein diacylglyceryl transferase [Verrucomicrobiota bacterium]